MLYRSTPPRGLLRTAATLLACLAGSPLLALAAPKTVCTITINSADERDTFQRHLPPGEYQFVELVKPHQSDWFAQACQSNVRCDALVISGHFDDGTEFYTDRVGDRDRLPVTELEQASCSNSCSGVLAQVKEVYLFGCNTLKSDPRHVAEGEVLRSLSRSGLPRAEAERVAAALNTRYGQSNRDRLRTVFKDVPLLYGFSSKAPLGRTAGPLLERYFQTAPAGEIASGRESPTMLSLFGPTSMVTASGLTDADTSASSFRQDMCRFADTRPADASKLAFLHQVLQRDVSEARMFLDHLERYTESLGPAQRRVPEVAAALEQIRNDQPTRERYLSFARDVDRAGVQVRMMALARNLGWLSAEQEQAEFLQMISTRMARNTLGLHDVDLVCATPQTPGPDLALQVRASGAVQPRNVAHSAALACLGDPEAHTRTLSALTSSRDDEVAIAQVYLRHRPLADVGEVRAIASGIGRMTTATAQVRALETLAKQRLADTQSLQEIARLFSQARSLDVQRAIAGILIRSDYKQLGTAELARSLSQHRLKSPNGSDVIDVLIRLLRQSA
ncbi:hypothetical protein ACVNIS_04350 [Sphaerotilaceae bacterium SBD11-9]